MTGLAFILRALRYKNYRLFFLGQLVSFTGTWMTQIATSWLVYRLTGSPWLLGAVAFANQFPAFLVSPFAGIYIDRWDNYQLIKVTQTFLMLVSFALAALTLGGWINIPALLLLNAVQGVVNGFDMPSRHAFVVAVVDKKEDLGNAIGLNSMMFNMARLLGPALGGLIVAASSEGWCFFIDGVSFLAVLIALWMMDVRPQAPRTNPVAGVFEQMKEGWKYAFGFLPVRSIILLLAAVSLLGFPYTVLVPIFAGDILHGGPHTLGFLMGAFGFGAFLGGLWLASRKTVIGLDGAIPLGVGFFGAGLIAFGCSRLLWLSLILMAATGSMLMVYWAASNTILQTVVDDDKRGRITSLFMMAFLGTSPVGSLLAGRVAEHIGAPRTVILEGMCCVLGAILFTRKLPALTKAVHPVYAKLGILPTLPALE